MPVSYLPARDVELRSWMENFSARIMESPAAYGLTGPEADHIAESIEEYGNAFVTASNPETRTISAVAAKDSARAAMLAVVRPYAIQIRSSLGVSQSAKLDLGLHLPDNTKSRLPAPATAPAIWLDAATYGVHSLRYGDVTIPQRRAKPFGAFALLLFRHVGEEAISDPLKAGFAGLVTRQPFTSHFANEDNGKTCTYFGRWITRTAKLGPWSSATVCTVLA